MGQWESAEAEQPPPRMMEWKVLGRQASQSQSYRDWTQLGMPALKVASNQRQTARAAHKTRRAGRGRPPASQTPPAPPCTLFWPLTHSHRLLGRERYARALVADGDAGLCRAALPLCKLPVFYLILLRMPGLPQSFLHTRTRGCQHSNVKVYAVNEAVNGCRSQRDVPADVWHCRRKGWATKLAHPDPPETLSLYDTASESVFWAQ
eukprot:350724-Chlamydomonas_euryale.AAC.4